MSQQLKNSKTKQDDYLLATNVLDDELWPNETILQEHKNQQSCEQGFRFLIQAVHQAY